MTMEETQYVVVVTAPRTDKGAVPGTDNVFAWTFGPFDHDDAQEFVNSGEAGRQALEQDGKPARFRTQAPDRDAAIAKVSAWLGLGGDWWVSKVYRLTDWAVI